MYRGSNSDTDSEPEISLNASGQNDYMNHLQASTLDHPRSPTSKEYCVQDIRHAVEKISLIDISLVRQDTSLHIDLGLASDTIIAFLDDACQPLTPGAYMSDILVAFTDMLQPSFLSILFDYRKVFHGIAAENLVSGAVASTIICWVDVIFAKLSEASIAIAGGLRLDTYQTYQSEDLRKHLDEDGLRAAAQLPEKWLFLPEVISSQSASPAAKRTALRLLFAAYIIGPQLRDYDPWNDSSILPSEMLLFLHKAVEQTQSDVHEEILDKLHNQEKTSYAIIVSLFASTESKCSEIRGRQLPPFRPHTLACLLYLIQTVMYPGDTIIQNLDCAQNILLRWGGTVPWCWSVWDDERLAHAASIVSLTETWLCHLNSPSISSGLAEVNDSEAWTKVYIQSLMCDPSRASTMISQILRKAVSTFTQSARARQGDPISALLDVIYMACWGMSQLSSSGGSKSLDLRESFLCLLYLFVMLGNDDIELRIKDLIVEISALVDNATIEPCIECVQMNTEFRFVIKLDALILACKRSLIDADRQVTPSADDLLSAKSALDFLAILLHSTSADGLVHRQTVLPFLATLVDVLLREHADSPTSRIIIPSLLTTASIMRKRHPDFAACTDNYWSTQSVWKLAIRSGRSNLLVASAFSHYILSMDVMCDALCGAEAWDYLRDVMLLVFSQHYVGDDEPMALIVCPSICRGLIHLLLKGDARTTRFMLASPWTLNLCENLRKSLSREDHHSSEYVQLLTERLEVVGADLLAQINHILRPSSVTPVAETTEPQWCLLSCHVDLTSHLLLVPTL